MAALMSATVHPKGIWAALLKLSGLIGAGLQAPASVHGGAAGISASSSSSSEGIRPVCTVKALLEEAR